MTLLLFFVKVKSTVHVVLSVRENIYIYIWEKSISSDNRDAEIFNFCYDELGKTGVIAKW